MQMPDMLEPRVELSCYLCQWRTVLCLRAGIGVAAASLLASTLLLFLFVFWQAALDEVKAERHERKELGSAAPYQRTIP